MAPSPPSRVPSKRRRFAEMQSAAPQIAPERMRKAIGKGLVRSGTKDNLSAISSPRPNAETEDRDRGVEQRQAGVAQIEPMEMRGPTYSRGSGQRTQPSDDSNPKGAQSQGEVRRHQDNLYWSVIKSRSFLNI